MHPYSTAYYRCELASMAALQPSSSGSVQLTLESTRAALDGYMYAAHRSVPLSDIPVLRLDGQVWMSLTPLEVQSAYMPIRLAHGRVGTAGLGLGYFVQRVLDKPDVERVTVFELRREVIDLYARTFGSHPKLEIRHANARLLEGERFDFFYADVYRQLLTPQVIDDMAVLRSANAIGHYHWWSIEQMVFEVMHAGLAHRLPRWMLATYRGFLHQFITHPCARHARVFGCGYELIEVLNAALALKPAQPASCQMRQSHPRR
jgi:hypothetical protein